MEKDARNPLDILDRLERDVARIAEERTEWCENLDRMCHEASLKIENDFKKIEHDHKELDQMFRETSLKFEHDFEEIRKDQEHIRESIDEFWVKFSEFSKQTRIKPN